MVFLSYACNIDKVSLKLLDHQLNRKNLKKKSGNKAMPKCLKIESKSTLLLNTSSEFFQVFFSALYSHLIVF